MKDVGREARRPEVAAHRRLRRALRRLAFRRYEQPAARHQRRRRRHQGRDRPALDKHDTIGFDLVGMLVDDLVVCGPNRCS
jgi:phosphoribosylformylglycinamidine cyclo-ligase